METKVYIVTDKAGPYVCGQRVKAGQSITLTDRQAKYELILESIKPVPVPGGLVGPGIGSKVPPGSEA